jgi:hypothetical protein
VTTNQELSIFASGMVNFLVLLVGLTAALSIARKLRIRQSRRLVVQPSSVRSNAGDETIPARRWADPSPTKPSYAALQEFRSAVRNAGSNPVNFFAEPDAGSTR